MSIASNIQTISENIKAAQVHSPNPNQDIILVAVTKTRSIEEINQVLSAGYLTLGENRVQELCDKYSAISLEAQWHIIGHLQSNKVKYITDKVVLIHSLDSESLAKELSSKMTAIGKTMDCLVQVNIANEESKYGLAKEAVLPFLDKIKNLAGIRICGLMNIAPYFPDPEETRPLFKQMYQLFTEIKAMQIPNVAMDILSMGMSHDYQVAVAEGANMVRIGSEIFKSE